MCAPAPQGLFLLRWQTARGSLEGLLWKVLNVKNSEGQGHRPLQEVLGAGGPRGQCRAKGGRAPSSGSASELSLGGPAGRQASFLEDFLAARGQGAGGTEPGGRGASRPSLLSGNQSGSAPGVTVTHRSSPGPF